MTEAETMLLSTLLAKVQCVENELVPATTVLSCVNTHSKDISISVDWNYVIIN